MLRQEDIDAVRNSVTMAALAGTYGMKINRNGFAKCPFHPDKSPSLKIYDGTKGYYCFVCNEGGDVIRFVQHHDRMTFEQAVRHIAGLFGIPISDGNTISADSKRRMLERRREKERQAAAEAARKARLAEISGLIQLCEGWIGMCRPYDSLWMLLKKKREQLSVEWEALFEGGATG